MRIITAFALLALTAAPAFAGNTGRAPLWIPVTFHLISNLGALFFAPVMHAFYASRAPDSWRGTFIGLDTLSVSTASLISGAMGGWYETMSPVSFWTIDAGIAATPTVGIVVRDQHAAGGLQISASHNPAPYNGLKLFSAEGRVLPAAAGRPILDRGIRFGETTLDQAVTYAIISLDSTMRSNVAVGPPIDLLVYANDDLAVKRYRRLDATDPDLGDIRSSWEQALRHAIKTVPQIDFSAAPSPEQLGVAFTRAAGRGSGGAI